MLQDVSITGKLREGEGFGIGYQVGKKCLHIKQNSFRERKTIMLTSKAVWVNVLVILAIGVLVLSGRMPVSDVTAIAVAAINAIIAGIKKSNEIEITQKLVSLAEKNEQLVQLCASQDERQEARNDLRERGIIR